MKAKRASKSTYSGPKRAIGYVRVSTTAQGEEGMASPEIQEADIRAYCRQHGYVLVAIFRDTQAYRVGNKMVEPSGSRSDRPGFLTMLKMIDAEEVDVIVAWKVDRLYRGINQAFVDLQDRVESNKVQIECVQDHYDAVSAPFLAAAARVELKAKKERTWLGNAGRLKRGKALNIHEPFGYTILQKKRDGASDATEGTFVVNEKLAPWVVKIFDWAAQGLSYGEIRKRLIEAGVQQAYAGKYLKNADARKFAWLNSAIHNILKHDFYYTGKYEFEVTKYGKFTLEIPKLVSSEIGAIVQRRLESYIAHPTGNGKTPALVRGKVKCEACGIVMSVRNDHQCKTNKKNPEKTRRYVFPFYICYGKRKPHVQNWDKDKCASWVSLRKVDAEVWEKVWRAFSQPDFLKGKLEELFASTGPENEKSLAEEERIRSELAQLETQRQRVIDSIADGVITKEDAAAKIGFLNSDRDRRQNELNTILKTRSLKVRADQLMQQVESYRAGALAKIEKLEPGTLDLTGGRELQFKMKQALVNERVKSVIVKPDKSVSVQLTLPIADQDTSGIRKLSA